MKRRNPHARALRDPRFRPRHVEPRKGRGSYTRKARSSKHESGPFRGRCRVSEVASEITAPRGRSA